MKSSLSVLTALLVLLAIPFSAIASGPGIDRVNKTEIIRCGYVEYNPALGRDVNTANWSGFDYDIVNAIADRLHLSADFAVPTAWGTVVADLENGKFDMLCSGFWVHPNVGRFALFSRPIFYQPVFVVARADDERFTASTDLNTPDLKMVALDGDNPVSIAKTDFPQAQTLILPNMTHYPEVMVNVATGKADFTIVDAYMFGTYNENNPGKLKIVAPDDPIRIYPVSYAFRSDDGQLRDAVNVALDELILDGTIDRIMNKYDVFPNAYYRATLPYTNPYQ